MQGTGPSSIEADALQKQVPAPQILPAAKFEVHCGRGDSDLIASRALEDVLFTLNEREEMFVELQVADRGRP